MNITIIGLGVIGGSLGLAIKQFVPRAVVTGYDDASTIDTALRREAIDYGARSLPASIHDADIIFVCTPVRTIIQSLPTIAAHCAPHAIVTDVGSTKGEIVRAAAAVFRSNGNFIGGHPMAGSEGKGIASADPLLFQNATYVLCTDAKKKKSIVPLTSILHSIGARVLFLSAKEHDTVAAAISHLPQLIAVAMMNLIGTKNKSHQAYLQLAAGGFRDITRIASSPYGMWNDILSSNSSEIRRVVREFAGLMLTYEKDLKKISAQKQFAGRFAAAKKLRDAIPKNSKGFLHPLYDVYVSVDDRPGILSAMTSALAKAKINIKDIELLKIRDGSGGTFRLSFDTKKDADAASRILAVYQ